MLKHALLKAVLEQSRIWLYVIATLVLLIMAMLIYQTQFYSPETEQLLQRKVTLQQQIKNKEAKLEESGVPASAVEQMEEDLLKFSEMVPPKHKFADFVGDLFHWAGQTELDIRQISYRPEIDKDTEYLNYGLSFAVQGEYNQLKKFIHLLENSKRLLIIDKITLSGKQSKDNSASVSLQINLTTFFQEGAQ